MIRIFVSTQPGVMALINMTSDEEALPLYREYLGRNHYLARLGVGWALYKPSCMPVAPALS